MRCIDIKKVRGESKEGGAKGGGGARDPV